jgi:hypothetical protein
MCWLARFDSTPCMMRADGQFDRCHLVPQQRIRTALRSRGFSENYIEDAVWHPDVWVHACRRHHTRFDSHFIELGFEDYPESLRAWAREYGFFWISERRGWVPMNAAAAEESRRSAA